MIAIELTGMVRTALAVAVLAVAISQSAVAFSPRMQCVPPASEAVNLIRCDIDAPDTSPVESVIQRPISGNRPITVPFASGPSEASTTALALVINRALVPARFQAARAALSSIAQNDAKYIQLSLWSFATDLNRVAPIGTPSATVRAALDGIRQGGRTVELLRSIVEVNRDLQTAMARRKIIVIASDGDFDDTAYEISEVSRALRENGVRLIVLLASTGAQNRTDAQALRRLSDESDGLFLDIGTGSAAQAAERRIRQFIENSGSVSVSLQPEPSVLEVRFRDGRTLVEQIAAAPVQQSTTAVAGSSSVLGAGRPEAEGNDFLSRMRLIEWYYWVAASVVLLSVAITGIFLYRRRVPKTVLVEREASKPEVVGDLRPILGWFEFLDANGTREPIRQVVTRIGRSRDNDLIVHNATVHRSHAVLKREPAGTFVIMDLDTENGVTVNGRRVKSEHVNDDDVIEIGEVRMRFKKI
jgi:hypothetical protein